METLKDREIKWLAEDHTAIISVKGRMQKSGSWATFLTTTPYSFSGNKQRNLTLIWNQGLNNYPNNDRCGHSTLQFKKHIRVYKLLSWLCSYLTLQFLCEDRTLLSPFCQWEIKIQKGKVCCPSNDNLLSTYYRQSPLLTSLNLIQPQVLLVVIFPFYR